VRHVSDTVDNKVAILVLQHPQEQDRVLGTAKPALFDRWPMAKVT
jgi:hypothetical protein